MWIVTLALVVSLAAFMGLSVWRGREALMGSPVHHCPQCDGELVALTDGPSTTPPRSYDVLACRDCGEGITMVHGTRSLFAYCPACMQLALQTTPRPAGHTDDGRPRVAVEEQCHLCGHSGLHVEPDQGSLPPGEGKVLPFRRQREESRDS